jgi:hypothetical protein
LNKQEFINSIKDGAQKGQAQYGILASLKIAQAILESGWGQSGLARKANNLFGIKAFSNWTGKRVTMQTTEYYNGVKTTVMADFRAYNTLNDSIEDHNKLLMNTRYKPVRECKDYKSACEKIYECGYATDPDYPKKLIRLIEENKLNEFDNNQALKEVAASNEPGKVLKFQQLCNALGVRDYEGKVLEEDNKLGPRTRSCIAKMPILRFGSRGLAVRFIQDIVKAEPIDGSFGPITRECVINYQRYKRIKVDGIVGIQTWTTIVTT